MWFKAHSFLFPWQFHDSEASRSWIKASLHLSSCLYYPETERRCKLSSSHILFQRSASCLCKQDAKGEHAALRECAERIDALLTRSLSLLGLLAILILICLEQFINCGSLGRGHGKKSMTIQPVGSQVYCFTLPCMKWNSGILCYFLSLWFYDTNSFLTSFLLHWFVCITHTSIHMHTHTSIHTFIHITTHTYIHTCVLTHILSHPHIPTPQTCIEAHVVVFSQILAHFMPKKLILLYIFLYRNWNRRILNVTETK